MKTQKKKESHRFKFYKADSSGAGGIGEALSSSISESQGRPLSGSDSSQPGSRQRKASVCSSDGQSQMNRIEEENVGDENISSAPDHKVVIDDKAEDDGRVVNGRLGAEEASLRIELGLSMEKMSKPLPPSNGFNLEYLGPARPDRKGHHHHHHHHHHPIFLMPDDRPSAAVQPGQRAPGRRPHSAKERLSGDKDGAETKPPGTPSGKNKAAVRPSSAGKSEGSVTSLRSGVHIREDRNVTVNITPRNLGRKVATGKSRKHRVQTDFSDLQVGSALPASGKASSSAEDVPEMTITATATRTRTQGPTGVRPATLAATISVVYDDDRDGQVSSDKKKESKRRGSAKEKDLVTMVSNISLSDEEDPSCEVDIEMGEERSDGGHAEQGRSPSSLSTGEGVGGLGFCFRRIEM